MKYNIYKYGQVTKFEAGVFYRNMKQGNIEVLPETISMMYDEKDRGLYLADERYHQDHLFYDRIYNAVELMLEDNHVDAQIQINDLQANMIARAGKKSRFYKYL